MVIVQFMQDGERIVWVGLSPKRDLNAVLDVLAEQGYDAEVELMGGRTTVTVALHSPSTVRI